MHLTTLHEDLPEGRAACERCFAERPELREVEPGHWVACHLVK